MIQQVLDRYRIEYQVQSGQVIVDCPYCDKPKHVYVDPEKQVFYCQRCGQKGTFNALLKELTGQDIAAPFEQDTLGGLCPGLRKQAPGAFGDQGHRLPLFSQADPEGNPPFPSRT